MGLAGAGGGGLDLPKATKLYENKMVIIGGSATVDIINVTGKGYLSYFIAGVNVANYVTLKIELDGVVFFQNIMNSTTFGFGCFPVASTYAGYFSKYMTGGETRDIIYFDNNVIPLVLPLYFTKSCKVSVSNSQATTKNFPHAYDLGVL